MKFPLLKVATIVSSVLLLASCGDNTKANNSSVAMNKDKLAAADTIYDFDDNDWKNWYDNISGRLMKIQNEDGSWNGHHCITSPVFCTATSVLLLTVENDIEFLRKVGE